MLKKGKQSKNQTSPLLPNPENKLKRYSQRNRVFSKPQQVFLLLLPVLRFTLSSGSDCIPKGIYIFKYIMIALYSFTVAEASGKQLVFANIFKKRTKRRLSVCDL